MSSKIRVLISLSQPHTESAIREHLQSYDIISVPADNIDIELVTKEQPDIVIVSQTLGNSSGLELARAAQNANLSAKFILVTLYKENSFYTKARSHGVTGFLFRRNAVADIEACLSSVQEGSIYISEELKRFFTLSIPDNHMVDALTPSERKILFLIALNNTTPKIAEKLFISRKTVEKHRSNISKKLNLSGKTNSLLLWAKENIEQQDLPIS